MVRTKQDQKGFSAIEGLLILVAVVLIGFIGWFVYNSQKNANATLNTNAQSGQSDSYQTQKKTKAEQSALLNYTDDSRTYTVNYPKTWTIDASQPDGGSGHTISIVASSQVELVPPNAPLVDTASKQKAGATIAAWQSGNLNAVLKDQLGAGVKSEQLTVNGNKALHATVVSSGYTDENYFITDGTTTVSLNFRIKQTKDAKTGVSTSFNQTAQEAAFMAMAKSVQFVSQVSK